MKKNSKKKNYLDIVFGAMLMVVVGIMPLIVRFTTRRMPPELMDYFPEWQLFPRIPLTEELLARYSIEDFPRIFYADLFTYWKGVFVLVPAIVIAFFAVSDWATRGKFPNFRELFRKPPVIFSCVYLAFVIISAFVPRYMQTSWFGTYSRGEGAFMWLAYFVLFFAAMYFLREIRHAKFILYALAFSSVIMGAIGVSQFIGRDFFDTGFARWLMTVGNPWAEFRHELNPTFTIAHGTLFNPNTFGQYAAMLSPVLLLAALTYDGKRYVNVIFLIAGALMLLGVFGSSSLGGLVGIVTAAVVLVVTYAFRPGIPWKRLSLAAAPLVLVVLAILFFPPLNYRVTFLFGRLGDAMRAETTAMQDYIFAENTMTVYGKDGKHLSITVHGFTGNWLTVRDGLGNEIAPSGRVVTPPVDDAPQPIFYTFDIPDYREITIEKYPNALRYIHETPVPFMLTLIDERLYGISLTGQLIDLHREIPAWGFEGRETWGSNRGYIWSRSFPLMPSRILIGAGPDTFLNVFPQLDMASGQRFFQHPYQFVDKAHNLFLQTWISTGGISAIALFALFGHYLLTTFISLVKSKGEPLFSYGLRLGLLSGISAYVMSSMATDTTIGSTGVFFVLLGVGYGLNEYHKKAHQEPQRAAKQHN